MTSKPNDHDFKSISFCEEKCSKCGIIRSLYSLSDTNFRTRYRYYASESDYERVDYLTCSEVTIKDILE